MSNTKKQNRVLYICLIILLVTASVLVAIASGSNKSEGPDDNSKNPVSPSESHKEDRTDAMPQMASPSETELESKETPNASENTDAAADAGDDASPVSIGIDDIVFNAPFDGPVLIPCSLSVPVFSQTMNDYRIHSGIDIAAESGSAVVSCAAGTVKSIWEDPMMGVSVKIVHADGIESVYSNLSPEISEHISEGAAVNGGDVIGAVGDTALVECEEEPHLHFELMVNGEQIDPCEYIQLKNISDVYED